MFKAIIVQNNDYSCIQYNSLKPLLTKKSVNFHYLMNFGFQCAVCHLLQKQQVLC